VSQRIKFVAVPKEDAELARRFYRRCTQLFGDDCTVTVRKTDAARRVPRGTASEPNLAPGETDVKRPERFPSKYVQAADLKPQGATVTIDRVEMEKVGQGSDQKTKPVLYFQNTKKAMVLNSTNDQTINELFGDDDQDWHGERICLFPTTTSFGGKTVACIRVRAVDKVVELEAAEEDSEDPAPQAEEEVQAAAAQERGGQQRPRRRNPVVTEEVLCAPCLVTSSRSSMRRCASAT
jgi:hypothetical protein